MFQDIWTLDVEIAELLYFGLIFASWQQVDAIWTLFQKIWTLKFNILKKRHKLNKNVEDSLDHKLKFDFQVKKAVGNYTLVSPAICQAALVKFLIKLFLMF